MAKVDSKRRIVLPQKVRERLGNTPGTDVDIHEEDRTVVVEPEDDPDEILEQITKDDGQTYFRLPGEDDALDRGGAVAHSTADLLPIQRLARYDDELLASVTNRKPTNSQARPGVGVMTRVVIRCGRRTVARFAPTLTPQISLNGFG